ncbi:helix-turn-helix domain-containing protein [Ancylobacter pratisalsi]|nr:XRE family transcriptional regulator [Ancylobacter pratisalsi]
MPKSKLRNDENLPDEDFGVETAKSELVRRLRLAVRQSGGATAAAAKSGVALGTLNNYLRGVNEPKASVLAKLAGALGYSVDWILELSDEPRARRDQHPAQPQTTVAAHDIVMLEHLSFSASAGTGALVLNDLGQTYPVRADLLQRLNLRQDHACMIEAVGLSMFPTIRDREILLVDKSSAARDLIRDGDIYLFTVDNEAYIKRLRREPGQWIMVSDNHEMFPPRPIPQGEHFAVIGRVCWGAHEL